MEPALKNSQNLGREAEDAAAEYLKGKGYTILERNWRYKKFEVDIIVSDSTFIVFVEVKARTNLAFGEPEVFVDRKKQKFLIAAAGAYIESRQIDLEARFDILAISKVNNNLTVKHLERAFYPLAM